MLIRKAHDLTYADVTPRSVYLDRRKFLRAMGIAGATAVAGKGLFDLALPPQNALAATQFTGLIKSPFSTTEKQNSLNDVSHYNNFYEFGSDKSDPAKNAPRWRRHRFSLCRRSASRRRHEPACPSLRRHVRRVASSSRRCAGSHDRPLEIRL